MRTAKPSTGLVAMRSPPAMLDAAISLYGCTKKCEIEAKFWLLDRLKEPAANAGDSAEL